jgi:hypothetical protein
MFTAVFIEDLVQYGVIVSAERCSKLRRAAFISMRHEALFFYVCRGAREQTG